MRKVFILGVAVALLLGATASVWAEGVKIGFADKMKILFEYGKTKELNAELEKEGQAARAEIEKRSEEIKKLRDEMELLSESARNEKRSMLEQKVRGLDDYRREKMQEIGRKQDEGIRKISDEIAAVCSKYGKSKGYDTIIDLRATLYAPSDQDITADILKELNK